MRFSGEEPVEIRESLAEAVRLFETYGLVAGTSDAGAWVNSARAALTAEPASWRSGATPAVGGETLAPEMSSEIAAIWQLVHDPKVSAEAIGLRIRNNWPSLERSVAAQPASPLRVQETCLECGTCDPCDDDCPNYIEADLPASPLRGRDALEPFIKAARVIAKRPDDYEYRIVMVGGLMDACDLNKGHFADLLAAVDASPPEQPAAVQDMFRCNCPFEARSGCSEPRCAHYAPPAASDQETT